MAILWHGVQRASKVNDPTAPKLWYAQWVQRSVVGTDELAELISESTTVSKTDVRAVLDALKPQIIRALEHSDSVRLDGLFSILTSVTGEEGTETPEGLDKVKLEADAYIRLHPDIQEALDRAKFQRED